VFFTAALAALASAVVFLWLFNPLSMLGAATRSEFETLGQRSARKTGGVLLQEGLSWGDLIAAANTEFRNNPERAAQGAVSRLLHILRDVDRGYRIAPDALPDAQAEAGADAGNLVARLAVATLVDISNAPTTLPGEVGPAAMKRYEAVGAVIEDGEPAAIATLHNDELTKTWYGVVKRFVKRPQVAASLAVCFPHDRTEVQFETLSVIQERLLGLAEELRKAGQNEEADRCIRWIAQLMIGLMKADMDAGTRLLCADLLARSLKDRPAVAEPLARMRQDFHAAASAAPIDICDQSFSQIPSVAPGEYRQAMGSLLFIGVLVAMGAGAAVAFVFSFVAAGMARLIRPAGAAIEGEAKLRRTVRMISSLIPSLILGGFFVGWFEKYGMFSELWGCVVAASLLAGGVICAVVSAGWMTERRGRDQSSVGPPWPTGTRRNLLPVIPGVLAALPVLLPPPVIAWLAREVELRVSIGWVLLPGLCLLVAVAMVGSPARWRTIAVAAAMAWCVNLTAALLVLPYHQIADVRYQKAVVSGRFDEITARLGADWEDKYLKPVKDAFALDRP
jgi:hypothetical protein